MVWGVSPRRVNSDLKGRERVVESGSLNRVPGQNARIQLLRTCDVLALQVTS